MKKNWLSLVYTGVLLFFVLGSLSLALHPLTVYARSNWWSDWWIDDSNPICTGSDCGANVGRDILKNNIEGKGLSTETDIIPLVLSWVRFFLGFVFVIAVIVLIVAGVMFITSFGNDTQNQKARKMILWTIIGILVIMLSYIIVSAIMGALTAA
jgi:multisubunit Na+/H+ antiporter MnhB subunit